MGPVNGEFRTADSYAKYFPYIRGSCPRRGNIMRAAAMKSTLVAPAALITNTSFGRATGPQYGPRIITMIVRLYF